MVVALKCMRCNALRLIDSLSVPVKLEECVSCGGRDILIVKSYNWKSLEDVDMDIVSKDEEDFSNCVGEFADENIDENDDEGEYAGCAEIRAARTFDVNRGFVARAEAVLSIGSETDVYVFYELDSSGFVFRVCDKSYYEYLYHTKNNEEFPIKVIKEIRNKIKKEDAEYFPIFNLVMNFANKVADGVRMPNAKNGNE